MPQTSGFPPPRSDSAPTFSTTSFGNTETRSSEVGFWRIEGRRNRETKKHGSARGTPQVGQADSPSLKGVCADGVFRQTKDEFDDWMREASLSGRAKGLAGAARGFGESVLGQEAIGKRGVLSARRPRHDASCQEAGEQSDEEIVSRWG